MVERGQVSSMVNLNARASDAGGFCHAAEITRKRIFLFVLVVCTGNGSMTG
jgi:hypothetical protein